MTLLFMGLWLMTNCSHIKVKVHPGMSKVTLAAMNRPAPVELCHKNMRFLITHNPTDSTLGSFIEVRNVCVVRPPSVKFFCFPLLITNRHLNWIALMHLCFGVFVKNISYHCCPFRTWSASVPPQLFESVMSPMIKHHWRKMASMWWWARTKHACTHTLSLW